MVVVAGFAWSRNALAHCHVDRFAHATRLAWHLQIAAPAHRRGEVEQQLCRLQRCRVESSSPDPSRRERMKGAQ